MRTITRDIVGALIISSDDKILFGKHLADTKGVYSGYWIVPGGGIEEGETKLQALQREMLEETGIDVTPYEAKPIGDITHGESEKVLKTTGEKVHVKMNFFDYEIRLDKPADQSGATPTAELGELIWVTFDELASTNLAPPTAELVKSQGYLR